MQIRMATMGIAFAALAGFSHPALARTDANDAEMMTHCNTYAAHHLGVSTSEISELTYEGQRTDGTHAVNGTTTSGQTFQCSFGPHGHHVVEWTHSGYIGCPADVSEANRYMYPDCD
ncbi:hypothetical protein PAF17_19830 [Paracoccus sp. Z330]|uniref:Uncharacterized protein n=1 Tax=Paracoccus onchidii TaxID=3017813 RepID=A0ABT4ZLR3_9RHOB|nr:hypothetical protein [Paracoccus onchidii]MDB6179701.1 hypothetical protein [Paracoccus onchidii]